MKRTDKEKKLQELQALEYEKASRSFAFFFRRSWPILEPQTPLLYGWHHDYIAEHLTACSLRQIKRLIINVPPRYGKSNLCTVTFPAWVWTHNPGERFVMTSYSSGLSTKHSVDRRSVIQSPWYTLRWGCTCGKNPHSQAPHALFCAGFNMATDQNVKTEFSNDRRGHMIATSMGGTATGKGGNILIVDDPHDTTRAASDIKREADILEFDQKFTTRLDDKQNGVIIVVMQRLHENDLTGHLLAQGGWTHICLPGVETRSRTLVFPMSARAIDRQHGDLLHPEREDSVALDAQRRSLGSYGFEAQYQQEPSPREGGIFKRTYWRRYSELPRRIDYMFDSWDLSFKDLRTSDFVAGTVWAVAGANRYLVHLTRAQLGFTSTIDAILSHRSRYPDICKTIIEEKANGAAILDVLRDKVPGLIPFHPHGSKEERAAAIEPQLEAGNVFLPEQSYATFDVERFIEVFAKFPTVTHDDEIDSTTQALLYARSENRPGLFAQAARDVENGMPSTQRDYDGSIWGR